MNSNYFEVFSSKYQDPIKIGNALTVASDLKLSAKLDLIRDDWLLESLLI